MNFSSLYAARRNEDFELHLFFAGTKFPGFTEATIILTFGRSLAVSSNIGIPKYMEF